MPNEHELKAPEQDPPDAAERESVEPMRVLEFDNPHARIAERRVLHVATRWARPPPRMLLDLSGSPELSQAPLQARRFTGLRVLDRFENAHLTWSDCFVLDRLFQNSFIDTGDSAARNLALRDAGSIAQRASGIVLTHRGFAIPEAKFADAIHIPGNTFFATPHEPHNWGLWLIHAMTALERFRREQSAYDKLFLYAHGPSMNAMLDMMDFPARQVFRHDVFKTYHFDSVTLQRGHKMRFHILSEERDCLRALALGQGLGSPTKRIFVSRRSRSREGYRQLVNEDALIEALPSLGFATVEPDLLPAGIQMRLFAEAEAVIGLGGAGMFNTIFCKPATKIVDIESTREFLEPHCDMFASLGLDYGVIVGAEDKTDASLGHRRWRIDLGAALLEIERFLKG